MAIHQILQDMQDAWAAKSGEGFAAHFADDHDFVVWHGMYSPSINREANAKGHQFIFDTMYKNWDVDLKVDKMRLRPPRFGARPCARWRPGQGQGTASVPHRIDEYAC